MKTGRQHTTAAEIRDTKVVDIERRIRQLKAMRKALAGLIAACDCDGDTPRCPIIEALDDSAEVVVD